MRWTEIASRLNQLGFGNFAVGWVPIEADTVKARRVIRFLEDRRMLFNDCAQEDINHCILSAQEIRKVLTEELGDLTDRSELLPYLRAIRSAAREFMDKFPEGTYRPFRNGGPTLQELGLFIQLGQLRSVIGLQVALLAARYEIDVEHDLARVLPTVT